MHRYTSAESGKMGTYMPSCMASPIEEVSKYFRKLMLLFNYSNNQNTQLTEFNRALMVHAVGRPPWLLGSQWSPTPWLYFKFQKVIKHVENVRFPNRDTINVSVTCMRRTMQSTRKNLDELSHWCKGIVKETIASSGKIMSVTLSIFFFKGMSRPMSWHLGTD